MATTKTSTVVEARRRAREAKATLDAERAKHDQLVEERTTEFYVAIGTIADLQEQITQAQADADAAVRTLLDLGEDAERVATLTGLSAKDVRRIRKAGSATPGSEPGPRSTDN